jgi:hypothetical protein
VACKALNIQRGAAKESEDEDDSPQTPPTPAEIEELNSSPQAELYIEIARVITASDVGLVGAAQVLCWSLVSLIADNDGGDYDIRRAMKTARWFINTFVKKTKYVVTRENEVIDLGTNTVIVQHSKMN